MVRARFPLCSSRARFGPAASWPAIPPCSASQLLLTVPGIAELSALQALARDPPAQRSPSPAVGAGLDVRHYSSGTSVRRLPHISKCGNHHLRRALFMPALVASRFDPTLRAFYQHLLAQGKRKRQALAAVMRKLLHAIFGMLRHQQPYSGSVLCPRFAEAL